MDSWLIFQRPIQIRRRDGEVKDPRTDGLYVKECRTFQEANPLEDSELESTLRLRRKG